MKAPRPGSFLLLVCTTMIAQGQEGAQWGNMIFRPDVSLTAAHDSRAITLPDNTYDEDFYMEAAAGLSIQNLPAKYNLSGRGIFGVRYYDDNQGNLSHFYNLVAAIGVTNEDALQWGLSADVARTLDYSTSYDPDTGQRPDPILTDEESTRFTAEGHIGYDQRLTDKMSLLPAYSLRHYHQEFQTAEPAEWQTHQASLQLRRRQSEKIIYTLGGYYTLQDNDDENGYIGTLMLGMEGRLSEKTTWLAEGGYAMADYEISGSDQGFVSNFQATWQATEKISTYVFGGTDFVPGYDTSPATWVYRLGYGAGWQIIEKLGLQGSVVHDYREEIGNGGASDKDRLFADISARYSFTGRLYAGLGARYVKDEKEPNQLVYSIVAGYTY